MRLLLFAILAYPSLVPAQEPPKADIVVTSATASTIRIADMNETVVVNGRLVRVADLLAALASLDSAEGRRLRNQEKQNHETPAPNVPPPKKSQPACSPHSAQSPSCVEIESKGQDPKTKPRPE
jgi:hypothetical protein